jgi:hypothetical protein
VSGEHIRDVRKMVRRSDSDSVSEGSMGTNYDSQAFLKWIQEKSKGRLLCPVCGGMEEWSINDTLHEMRAFKQGDLAISGPIYPVVLVMCKSCGYVLPFSAAKLGLAKGASE